MLNFDEKTSFFGGSMLPHRRIELEKQISKDPMAQIFGFSRLQTIRYLRIRRKWEIAMQPFIEECERSQIFNAEDFNFRVRAIA